MINIATGQVKELLRDERGLSYLLVEVITDCGLRVSDYGLNQQSTISTTQSPIGYPESTHVEALCFNQIIGNPEVGDIVVLNTTAYDMQLGSGAYCLVVGILFKPQNHKREDGHIIKLRYTPFQFPVKCVEEEESTYHKVLQKFVSLGGTPVVVGMLTSQVAIACCVLKSVLKEIKIAYIMTDTSSLSLQISEVISQLKAKNYLDWTITCGQAFGGDYEAVNIYSALAFAKEVLGAEIIVVSPGVGGVGTNTKYGFSSIAQGEMINAVNILQGVPFAILRISFADKRKRHYGLSHHSITVLSEIAITPAVLCVPYMRQEYIDLVIKQISAAGIDKKHIIKKVNADIVLSILSSSGIKIKTMGRDIEEDKEFFLSAGASALTALEEITKEVKL